MRADRERSDFDRYAVARWPLLVGVLCRHGVAVEDAQRAAELGLARCGRDWRRLREDYDVDLLVLRAVALVAGLERGEEVLRADLAAPVSPELVAAPLDIGRLHGVERAEQRRERRRTARTLLVVCGVLVGAVGTAVWLTRPGPPPELAPLAVRPVANPLGLVWRDSERMHLLTGTVRLPGVLRAAQVRDGVVYGDRSGRVVLLRADGSREPLGWSGVGAPIASWTARGVVAWVDEQGDQPLLRVRDVLAGADVAARQVPGGSEVVAVTAGGVLFTTPGASWSLPLPRGRPERVPGPLGAAYTGDGGRSIVYVDSGRPDSLRGRLELREEGGERLDTGVRAGQVVLDATFAPDGDLVLATGRTSYLPRFGDYVRLSFSGPVEVYRCRVTRVGAQADCRRLVVVNRTGSSPTFGG